MTKAIERKQVYRRVMEDEQQNKQSSNSRQTQQSQLSKLPQIPQSLQPTTPLEQPNIYKRFRHFLRDNGKTIIVWILFNLLIAGGIYLAVELCVQCNKGLFYVLNKEAFNGYFYAWSITLLSGAVFSLITNKNRDNRKCIMSLKWLFGMLSCVLVIIILCVYINYSKTVNVEMEAFVDSLKIEKMCPPGVKLEYQNIETLPDSINTKEFIDRIDEEQLKRAMVHYNFYIVNPLRHTNCKMIGLTVGSFLVSLISFCLTLTKPKIE